MGILLLALVALLEVGPGPGACGSRRGRAPAIGLLATVAVQLHVTELVDGSKGVHAILPKRLFIDQKCK